jgi:formylglycine-generating enzyme required for sulfatase activity
LATGGNHQKKWPWGDDNPPGFGAPEFGQFSDYVLAGTPNNPANTPTKPTAASNRQANGYGLKDLIGNVAEFTEDAWEENLGGTQQVFAYVYGGSYLGLDFADEGDGAAVRAFTNPNGQAPTNLFGLNLKGPASETSPAIGFRCVTYE